MKKKKEHEHERQEDASKPQGHSGSRRVYLFGRLENDVTQPIITKLLKLNKRDQKTPIDLYINSSGGNGYNADAIIAIMHSIEAPVNTICLGHALSGACEILASGTGERSAYEFATLMFHQTLWEADGDITNLEIQAAQGQRFREAQIELLRRCTGQSKDKIRKDIERDYYMSADDALRYGIIDKVIYHTSAARRATPGGGVSAAAAGKALPKAAGADKPVKSSGRTGRNTASRSQATKSGRIRNGR